MLSIIFMIVARISHCKLFFLFSADNFHDHCTYPTLWAVFLFSADFGNATVSTNSKQVGLRHSRGVNLFYFSGLSFRDTQRVWVFWVWVFETPRVACRTGVIFCLFQGNRGESKASGSCAPPLARNSRFALASLSPLLARNTQKITPVLQAILHSTQFSTVYVVGFGRSLVTRH